MADLDKQNQMQTLELRRCDSAEMRMTHAPADNRYSFLDSQCRVRIVGPCSLLLAWQASLSVTLCISTT